MFLYKDCNGLEKDLLEILTPIRKSGPLTILTNDCGSRRRPREFNLEAFTIAQ